MGILEKIAEIEAEMKRTQKNKATNAHLGSLKAKLAKLRQELLLPKAGSGEKGEGFDVEKTGNARIALIGFPSVGKSSLLAKLTGTKSEAAAYEFTTLTCIPGNIYYKGVRIQLLDLPGIIEGAAKGKGRGRQVISTARSADLILIVLDAGQEGTKRHREILEAELESVGLRLNKTPADISYKEKKTGGIKFSSTVKLTKLGNDPEKTVISILREYRVHNATVLFREDASIDELIDKVQGNRKYVKCLYVYNKIDTITMEKVDILAHQPNSLVASVHMNLNLDYLLEAMWEKMGLVRIYTKRKGGPPDFTEPVVLSRWRHGITVEGAVKQVSTQLLRDFNYAMVWGTSTKHSPQRCGLKHILEDEDVLQVVPRTTQQQRRGKDYAQQCQDAYDKYKRNKKKKILKT